MTSATSSATVARESTSDASGSLPVVERSASGAHQVVDAVADRALTGVGKVSGSLHVAVNQTADAVADAAQWVAHVPTQIAQQKAKLASAAVSTLRAHPLLALASTIAFGYIVGRLARR